MRKLLMMVVLAVVAGLVGVVLVRRRAESQMPVEGFGPDVPLAPVPPAQEVP